MEDTNRMRTKLRLDLNDVNRQISELEKTMSKNRSEELLDQHRKLIAYKEKLSDQYEKVTGLNYTQISDLGVGSKPVKEPSGFGRILGILVGITLMNAYYNLNLHSIGLYGYDDFANFVLGQIPSVHADFESMIHWSILIDGVYIITLATLGIPIVLSLFRALISKSRRKIFSFSQSLAHVIPTGFILYSLTLAAPEIFILDNLDIFLYSIAGSAFLSFLATLGSKGFMGKLLSFINTILYALSAYMMFLTSSSSDVMTQLLYDWVYIFSPIMLVGLFLTIGYLFEFFED